MYIPEIVKSLKEYNSKKFSSDLISGLVVGIVALPLAIAFGIASGVAPSKGLITAIIGGLLVSIFGGSRFQIGGPTGAFIIIVYGIIQEFGIMGLTIATAMAGTILIIMGIIKFGSLIKYIPYPVVVGFTSGIALLIFSTQIKDFLGMHIDKIPSEFHLKWYLYFSNITNVNIYSSITGISSLIIIILWQKITHKVPGSIIAIIITTLIVQLFHLPIETIGSKFGSFSSGLPTPTFLQINLGVIQKLIQPATAIALLAAIESLLSAVVADGMTGTKHNSNMELIAQGIANIGTSLFGGIPVTGAIARTATNIKNGGKTPVAGIIHALVLLFVMLFFGNFAMLIPMPTLAAILIVVSYNMSEWRSFKELLSSPKSDIIVLFTTFFLTVVFDLSLALEVGMVLSAFLFMKRMSEVTSIETIRGGIQKNDVEDDPNNVSKKIIPHEVDVFEINGPFFFGAVNKFTDEINIVSTPPKIIIIRMRNVLAIDATGLNTIKTLYHTLKKKNIQLILSGVHTQPLFAMTQSGILNLIDEKFIFGNIDDALDKARELLGLPQIGRPLDFVPTVKREIQNKQ